MRSQVFRLIGNSSTDGGASLTFDSTDSPQSGSECLQTVLPATVSTHAFTSSPIFSAPDSGTTAILRFAWRIKSGWNINNGKLVMIAGLYQAGSICTLLRFHVNTDGDLRWYLYRERPSVSNVYGDTEWGDIEGDTWYPCELEWDNTPSTGGAVARIYTDFTYNTVWRTMDARGVTVDRECTRFRFGVRDNIANLPASVTQSWDTFSFWHGEFSQDSDHGSDIMLFGLQ